MITIDEAIKNALARDAESKPLDVLKELTVHYMIIANQLAKLSDQRDQDSVKLLNARFDSVIKKV